ncbi:phage head protein [Vibrio sp. V34_P3A8T189]|uniref:Mu-like prophage major head subunit gpT family protein n=1 Tax=unclassified Vibrio TaxID=2614977 RepID=UPI001372DF76|nr:MULTISPECIES: Mu-like prophage major head subunit gpT family protein [unclassified Vibrio]NAX01443.1 phage head protein [Vibrio sp. V34_P3A8T189]NAX07202.1 phage head protein [Vibrio sp. V40_P2S30T141]
MALSEAQVIEALFASMNASFVRGVDAAKPQWNMVATEVPSSGASNLYGWLKDLPEIKEWVGDRQLADIGKHGYQILNKTFESSISVKREDVEDDQIGQYSIIAQRFGDQATMFPDKLAYPLLVAGFTTLCYDGQNFFDTDHPLDTTPATTFSNVVGDPSTDEGSPWFLLDTSQVLKPVIYQNRRPFVFKNMNPNEEYTWFNNKLVAGVDGRCNVGFSFPQLAIGSKAVLNEANYEAAIQLMGAMKRADGTPLGVRPTTLVVGYQNRAAAKKLIDRMLIEGGDSNPYYKDVEIVVSPFIA